LILTCRKFWFGTRHKKEKLECINNLLEMLCFREAI
jgi:hypothetical protein